MFNLPTQPQKLKGLFFSSWELYKASFSQTWIWSLLITLTSFSTNLCAAYFATKFQTPPALFLKIFLILVFISMLILLIFHTALLTRLGKITGLITAPFIQHTLRSSLKLFFTSLVIFGLFLLGVIFLWGIPRTFLIKPVAALFGIAGILLYLYFLICVPIIGASLIQGGKGILSCIGNGVSLVWGKWWQTLIFFLSPLLPIIILMSSVTFLIAFLGGFGKELNELLTAPGAVNIKFYIIRLLIGFPVSFLYIPFFFSQITLQFNNLRVQKKI